MVSEVLWTLIQEALSTNHTQQ